MADGVDIAFASAEALSDLYRKKALSPVEATEILFARIDALQPKLNAFCIVDRDGALKAARASEERWRQGTPLSPIDGVPVTIKDLVLMRGFPTLRGSKLIDPGQDWSEDGPAVARLREAGAVILGKTTTPEFGWKAIGDSPLTGITRNPWNSEHTTGGSSAGAAAACAAGCAATGVTAVAGSSCCAAQPGCSSAGVALGCASGVGVGVTAVVVSAGSTGGVVPHVGAGDCAGGVAAGVPHAGGAAAGGVAAGCDAGGSTQPGARPPHSCGFAGGGAHEPLPPCCGVQPGG
ncbi:MAG: hypothetical protein JO008_20725 [Alphaproteobacteria bacterium]|nr:hypothetical protein [Alphaproteobacteria bacterium]